MVTAGALALSAPSWRRLWADICEALRPREVGRWHLVALAAIVVVGAVVRATFLGYGLRYDEAFSFLEYAGQPVAVGLADYSFPNNHLLNTLLMHYSWQAFGDAEWSLRLPTFLFGVALVPAVYAAARSLYTPSAGLLAAALAAGSTPFIEYSANARGYSATWLACALMIPLTVRLMRGHDPAAWVAWTLLAIVGVFAVPIMGLSLIVLGVWLGLEFLRTRRFLRIAELMASSLVVAGWSWLLYRDTFGDPGWDWSDTIEVGAGTFITNTFEASVEPLRGGFAILVLALAVAGILLHRRIGRTVISLPLVTVAVVPLVVLGLPDVPPYERTWLWVTPILLSAVAAGAVVLARWMAVRAAWNVLPAGAVGLALVLALSTRATEPPWGESTPLIGAAEVADWLAATRPPEQLLIDKFGEPSWDYTAARTETLRGRIVSDWSPAPEGSTIILVVNRAEGQTLGDGLIDQDVIDKVVAPPEKVFEGGELELWRIAAASD